MGEPHRMGTLIESTHHLSGEPHERVCALVLRVLKRAEVPVLVGGAFAFTHYTGIVRDTKDLDLFVREADVGRALGALAQEGFETSLPFPHWLAKAQLGGVWFDIIFASGNGLNRVGDDWFQYARDASLYGELVRIMPAEEMLCSKAFVVERERYDGAEVAHLISTQGQSLDWERIIRRFGEHVPVLFSHLVLFLYVYSDGAERIPPGLFEDVQARTMAALQEQPDPPVCRGTLLSRAVSPRHRDARLCRRAPHAGDDVRVGFEGVDRRDRRAVQRDAQRVDANVSARGWGSFRLPGRGESRGRAR
jgi:hypothetical protein